MKRYINAKTVWFSAVIVLCAAIGLLAASSGQSGPVVSLNVVGYVTNYSTTREYYSAVIGMTNARAHEIRFRSESDVPLHNVAQQSFGLWKDTPYTASCGFAVRETVLHKGEGLTFSVSIERKTPFYVEVPYRVITLKERVQKRLPASWKHYVQAHERNEVAKTPTVERL